MNQMREYASDEAKLKVYAHRLRQAEDQHDRWTSQGKEWVNRYRNLPNPAQFSGNGHNVSVPTGTSVIDSLFSSLTATDIQAMVRAIGKGTRIQEALATAALDKEWDICRVNDRAAKAIKDALLVGVGWVKVSYEYATTSREVPRKDEDIAGDVEKLILEAEAAGHDLDVSTIQDSVPLTEMVDDVLIDRIVVDYVPWDKLLWDPTAKQVEDVRWHAQLTLMHPEEVKANPTFKAYCGRNKTSRKLQDLGSDHILDLGQDVGANEEDERVTIVEMYDYETGTVCTFAKGSDFLLNEAPNPLALNFDPADKSPFVPVILRRSPGMVRGVSEMEVMLPTLQELDLYHSKLATYLERMAPKVLGKKGAFSDSGREAMASQEYGAFVEMEQGMEVTDIKEFNPPTLQSEMYGVPDKLEQAVREATGVNELMRGLFPDRRRTATETAEVVQSSAARQAEKRVQLERFYEAIGRRMLQYMQMFYSADRMVRYVSPEGPVEWTWTADDIAFENQLDIVLTPKETKNWMTRRDDALAVLNVLGPLAQPGPMGSSPVDLTELLRYVLEELGLDQRTIVTLLNLPEEQQAQMLAAQQAQAAQMSAQQLGIPRPDMVPGPMDAAALAQTTNAGEIPPEILAAAMGNVPVTPQAAEVVSEDVGVIP